MSLPENKTLRVAVIPWVMAIIALVGLNALASVHRFTKKQESSHESSISEISDDLQTRGRISDPLVFIEPDTEEETKPVVSNILIPLILPEPVVIDTGFKAGVVRGRAPPAQAQA